jgi:hypothetical protein
MSMAETVVVVLGRDWMVTAGSVTVVVPALGGEAQAGTSTRTAKRRRLTEAIMRISRQLPSDS